MEKQPKFLRDFSKEQFAEKRNQTAKSIREKRREYFTSKNEQAQKRSDLEARISAHERAADEKVRELQALGSRIAELSGSRLKELVNFLKLKKLRADLAIGVHTYDELVRTIDRAKQKARNLFPSPEIRTTHIPRELHDAQDMLSEFYKEQRVQWAQSDYTAEALVKNFSEEHLSSLSADDYGLLLSRFPSSMVAHVTRQGIRDHTGHMFHTKGEGEYSGGFMKMLADGRLRSPLGVYLVEQNKAHAIEQFLCLETRTKEQALEYVDQFTKAELQGSSGERSNYSDRMAIHFAAQEVADIYYGSEKGNEIFIAYPADFISSQYYFNGNLKQGGGYWNDQWVWANEERGMALNAGIVFIPRTARVGRATGSRYEIGANGGAVVNTAYKDTLKAFLASPDFQSFSDGVLSVFQDSSMTGNVEAQLEPYRKELEKKFGIIEPRLQSVIVDNYFLNDEKIYGAAEGQKNNTHPREERIEEALHRHGILFTEAQDTISSQEFWENYFLTHPNERPSKVVYYEGADPTEAMNIWKNWHGIYKREKESDFNSSKRLVRRDSPEATAGMDRFRSLAEKVIEEYFSKKPEGNK